jgi:hypothetical protein
MKSRIVLLLLTAGIISCDKESPKEIANGIRGYFVLEKMRHTTFTPTGKYETYEESVATIFDKPPYAVDPGQVRVIDSFLTLDNYRKIIKNSNFRNGFTNLLEGAKEWTVVGNNTSGVQAFSITSPKDFSSVALTEFSSVPEIDRSIPFTINLNTSVPCDSISIEIRGYDGKRHNSGYLSGTISSYTLTPSQLAHFVPSNLSNVPEMEVSSDVLIITGLMVMKEIKGGIAVECAKLVRRIVTVKIK